MKVNFEEKTFENYFNAEVFEFGFFFPPGQVQEGLMGFDSAIEIFNPMFWRLFGLHFPFGNPRGISLTSMERELNWAINDLPQFQVNLVLQYKRPDYLTRRNAGEWHLWDCNYYRYWVREKQHDLLLNIHDHYRQDVKVFYVSPAISSMTELVIEHRARNILSCSNIASIENLRNHHHNTYIAGGNSSKACSEVEEFENLSFREVIRSLGDSNNNSENNALFVISLANSMSKQLVSDGRVGEAANILLSEIERFSGYELIYSFLKMSVFRQLTDTQWIIKLRDR